MKSEKQRVFLVARKRGIALDEVREVLEAVGCRPTHSQQAVDRAVRVVHYTTDDGLPGHRSFSYTPAHELRDCTRGQADTAVRILIFLDGLRT